MKAIHFSLVSFCTIMSLSRASVVQFTASQCVDTSGFTKCWATAQANANECFAQNCNSGQCLNPFDCGSADEYCVNSCVCVAYRDWINCALSHCWNTVYSCAYQALVIQAFRYCEIATVFPPYYPAPANAPGGCSCNIGGAYKAIRYYRDDGNICNNYINDISGQLANGYPLKYHNECDCCAISGELSALPNICPNTDPASIPFWSNIAILQNAAAAYPRCVNIMATATCTAAPISFPTPSLAPDGQFYAPGEIPAPGTQPISDASGGLAHPVSGSVITWSLAKGALTAVATAATRA